jgi:hypothetical protein
VGWTRTCVCASAYCSGAAVDSITAWLATTDEDEDEEAKASIEEGAEERFEKGIDDPAI